MSVSSSFLTFIGYKLRKRDVWRMCTLLVVHTHTPEHKNGTIWSHHGIKGQRKGSWCGDKREMNYNFLTNIFFIIMWLVSFVSFWTRSSESRTTKVMNERFVYPLFTHFSNNHIKRCESINRMVHNSLSPHGPYQFLISSLCVFEHESVVYNDALKRNKKSK